MKKNYYAKALALTVAASMVSVPAFAAEENEAATLQAAGGIATLPMTDEEKPVVVAEEEPAAEPTTQVTTGDSNKTVTHSDESDTPTQVTSGYCGDPEVNEGKNVEWAFDADTGVLTISGTGAIANEPAKETNWAEFAKDIKEIKVREPTTTLGNSLLRGTDGITVYIPSSVTQICNGDEFVNSDSGLGNGKDIKIVLDDRNTSFVMKDGVLFTADGKTLVKYTREAEVDYTVPDGVETLAPRSFGISTNLTNISIPASVTRIGKYALQSTPNLNIDLVFPDTVTEVAGSVLSSSGVTSVNFGNGITEIPGMFCSNSKQLKSVFINKKITEIPSQTFMGCESLTTVIFEEGSTLRTIGRKAFDSCTSLESITLPESVRTITEYAFSECSALSSIYLNEGLESIGTNFFQHCYALTDIEIPSTINTVEKMGQQVTGVYSATVYSDNVLNHPGLYTREVDGTRAINWYDVDGVLHNPGSNSITSKTKVYGVYSANTTLDANSGSGNTSDLTTYFAPGLADDVEIAKLSNKSCNLPVDTFTREGYALAGWNTKEDGTGTNYAVDSELPIGKNHIETLYAQWGKPVESDVYSVASSIPDQTYDGTAKEPAVTVYKNGKEITEGYDVEYKDNTNAGTATATVKVGDTEIGTVNFNITKAKAKITPSVDAMKGAGTVALTVDGIVENEINGVHIVCDDTSVTVKDNGNGKYTASLPNATKTYTFTIEKREETFNADNYVWDAASCDVSVSRKKSSSSSSDTSAPTYGVSTGKTENGEISVTPAKAEAGETVTIKAAPDSGYQLDNITVKDKNNSTVKLTKVDDNEYTFTMPSGKVSVDATFAQKDAADDNNAAETGKTIKLQIGSRIVNVDNEAVIYDVAPVIRNDRTLVPIRIITETLGGKVDWNGATKEVTLSINDKEIKMTIGKTLEKYGVAPVIIDGRTFVPVRFVADELGATVAWDDATKTVTIKTAR